MGQRFILNGNVIHERAAYSAYYDVLEHVEIDGEEYVIRKIVYRVQEYDEYEGHEHIDIHLGKEE